MAIVRLALVFFANAAAVAAALGGEMPAPEGMSVACMYNVGSCGSVDELEAWHRFHKSTFNSFIPANFQSFAAKNVDSQYRQRLAQLRQRQRPAVSSVAFPEVLRDAVKCQSIEELAQWHSAAIGYVQRFVRAEYRLFALADVRKLYQHRADQLQPAALSKVSVGSVASQAPQNQGAAAPAGDLAHMLRDAEHCENEADLKDWRLRVSSFVREQIPPQFHIPALNDVQMQFDRRSKVLRKMASGSAATAGGGDAASMANFEEAHASTGGSSWGLVLFGLGLPAAIALCGAAVRSKRSVKSGVEAAPLIPLESESSYEDAGFEDGARAQP